MWYVYIAESEKQVVRFLRHPVQVIEIIDVPFSLTNL